MLIISITISARRLMTLLTSVLIACPNYIRKNKNLLKISPLALDLYWSPFLSSKKVLTQQGFRKKKQKKKRRLERALINTDSKSKRA